MEKICSSEISVDFQRTTQRYIPEDGIINNNRRENRESCTQTIAGRSLTGKVSRVGISC
jgi:hypothetical protein